MSSSSEGEGASRQTGDNPAHDQDDCGGRHGSDSVLRALIKRRRESPSWAHSQPPEQHGDAGPQDRKT